MSQNLPQPYSSEDDELLKETVESALREGRTIGPALEELAARINRTAGALNYRYYNVIKKREPEQTQEEFQFVPFTEEKRRGNPTHKMYSVEEDERIREAIQIAEEEGIPLYAIYTKLAEELGRTAVAIEARCSHLRKRHRDESPDIDDDSDDEDDGKGVLSKLKSLVKERDFYKKKFEETEDKLRDYDRMAREYRKIRKLLE